MMERMMLEYIANAFWQVPLLAGAAFLVTSMVRPNLQIQHRIWLGVLALAVLLPMHGLETTVLTHPPVTARPVAKGTLRSQATPTYAVQPRPPFQWTPPRWVRRTRQVQVDTTTAHWLVGLYLTSVVFGLLRIAQAWLVARNLVAHAREVSLPAGEDALADCSRRMQVKSPQLRCSGEVSSPMIVGVRRPVVLLPADFAGYTQTQMRAALCHELAHVKRQDYLVNFGCQLAALPLVWHPMMTLVQQRIRMTREMVCDAMAARELDSEIGYAQCLLALAHSMLTGSSMAGHEQFLGLFSNNTLEERVMRLTETTRMSLRAKVVRIVSGTALMAASLVVSASFHLTPTMAEMRGSAPPQAMQTATGGGQTSVAVPPAGLPTPDAAAIAADGTRQAGEVRADKQPHRGDAERQRTVRMANRKKIEEARQQAAKAAAMINSPQFKKQMEDAQRQVASATAMIDGPQFKKQMEEARRRAADAAAMIDSPQFKQQMKDAAEQAARAKAMLESPAFKRQIESARQQAAKASAMINSPEFQQRLKSIQDRLQSGDFQRKLEEEMQRPLETSPQTETAPTQ